MTGASSAGSLSKATPGAGKRLAGTGAVALFATGGLAIGWMAFGGLAVAWNAAKGGGALAHDFAIGGSAWAAHANDDAARAFVENSWFFSRAEPMLAGMERAGGWFPLAILMAVIVFVIAFWLVAYRRRQGPA